MSVEVEPSLYLHGFEALGVPLMAAVTDVLVWQGVDELPAAEKQTYVAQTFNGLLTASIVLSTRLADHIGLTEADTANGMRLKASALAARMVADYFRAEGDVPDEAALNLILNAQQPLLAISESIVPPTTPEHETPFFVAGVEALYPLITALSHFAFGEDPRTLGHKLAGDLNARVTDMLAGLEAAKPAASAQETDQRRATLFKGSAALLTSCVEAEQQAVADMGQTPSLELAVQAIWVRFDDLSALMRQMLGFLFGLDGAGTARGTGSSSRNVEPKSEKKIEAKAEKKGNPMSFFAKKPAGGMGGR